VNKYEFVLFFFVCTSFLSYGQNKTSLIRLTDSIYSDRNAPPESKISELKSILKAQDTLEISERIAHVYHRIGLLYERSGFYNLAIKKYNKAAEIRQEVVPINYYKLNNSLYNSSNCYNALGKKDDRREVFWVRKHPSN